MTKQSKRFRRRRLPMGGTGGGFVETRERSGRREQATAGRRSAPPGFGGTARRAAGSPRILADHQGYRDRYHGHQRVRHRGHRRIGPPRVRAVLRPRPDAAARQHAHRDRHPGGRVAVVPPLWDANIRLDHSVRTVPEALTVANEDISAGLAMLEARHIAGDAELSQLLIGGGATAMADRNRYPFRGTRRAHPGALAAQRADCAPRGTGPQMRSGRAARRSAAECVGDRPTGGRVPEPLAGVADRLTRRRAPRAAQRAHRTTPVVQARP